MKQMLGLNPNMSDEDKEKVKTFLGKLMKCRLMMEDFTFILDDDSSTPKGSLAQQ